MPRIFISHHHADTAIALGLGRWLDAQGLDDYFLDVHPEKGLTPPEDWQMAVDRAVKRCDAMLVLLSPDWLRSFECRHELRQAQADRKLWFAVKVRALGDEPLGDRLDTQQWCDLTVGTRWTAFAIDGPFVADQTTVSLSAEGLENLYRGLCAAGLDASTFVWPPPDDPGRCPYPGLRALDESDAGVFFGRGAEIVDAIEAIREADERATDQLFVILGASGTGKSSFLRAGLLPRLRRDAQRFVVLPVIRPERAAIEGTNGLLNGLKVALQQVGSAPALADIRDAVDGGRLVELLDAIARSDSTVRTTAGSRGRRVVIPVDQAEELFGDEAHGESARFVALMDSLIARSGPADGAGHSGVLVVVTIRTDALSRLQQTAFARRPQLFSLPPMPATEFKSVIEGPARRHSRSSRTLEITEGLADELARDAQQVDSLPLLAMTLESLYREFERGEAKVVLGVDQYRQLGRMETVIVKAVERALEDPSGPALPARRDEIDQALNRIFPLLATIDPETKAFKRRVADRASFREIPHADALIERLVDQRLLEADCRRLPGATTEVDVVEVAHEAVIVQWKAFARWLTEYKGSLIALELVCRATEDWNENGRDTDLLVHTGHRRAVAEGLLDDERVGVRLSSAERRYLEACRRRDWGRRAFAAAFAIGSVVGLVFLSLWAIAIRDEERQASLTLATAAESAIERDDLEQARRLAVLATRDDWLHPSHDLALPRLVRAAGGNVARIVAVQPAAVRTVAISPDGQRMLITSDDHVARIHDMTTGVAVGDAMRHDGTIARAAFSPDGRRVVTASADGTARLWDAATGRPLSDPLRHEGAVRSARFSADGSRVVTGSDDQTARVWDVPSGRPASRPLVHDSAVVAADFEPDGDRVITVSGHAIRLWDVATASPIGAPMVSPTTITGASFSPDGKRVAAILQKSADLWDLERRAVVEPRIEHDDQIRSAGFSRDGRRLVTASDDRTARIWRLGDGASSAGAAVLPHPGAVLFAAFGDDGRLVLTGSDDGRARIWNDRAEMVGDPLPHLDAVDDGRFSDDGARVVTVSRDRTARIWDVDTLRRRSGPSMHVEAAMVSADFSPDGTRLVTASTDRSVQWWDVGTGEPIGAPLTHDGAIVFLVVAPDGTSVVTVSNEDEVARWSAQPGPAVARRTMPGPVLAVRFVGQALRVVIGVEHENVRVLDAATGEPLGPLIRLGGTVKSADLSPDGKTVVTGSASGAAERWDVSSGQRLGDAMIHEDWVKDVAFSADGRRLLTVAKTNARVWDARNGDRIGATATHPDRIGSARFSPDGSRLVTTSVSGVVRIWDVRTGLPIDELRAGGDGFAFAAFDPDGRKLVTGAADGTARIWSVDWSSYRDQQGLRRAVCARMNGDARRITEADRQAASEDKRVRVGRDACTGVVRP